VGVGKIIEVTTELMKPRIFVYKVTFEEIPDFYWGVHRERKFNDGYLGSPVTHRWKWEFYTPHLQILQLFDYSDEGWEEALKVEERIIRPDLNNPLCLNEGIGMRVSMAVKVKTGKKVFDPSYWGINNPNHPSYGVGGAKGGRKSCDPSNPRGVNNPNHPCYHERNKRSGERALKAQGKPVRMTKLATGESWEFPSIRRAAAELNLLQGNLTNLLNPDHPLKTYKGYVGEKL
jgi:hypothetical protein